MMPLGWGDVDGGDRSRLWRAGASGGRIMRGGVCAGLLLLGDKLVNFIWRQGPPQEQGLGDALDLAAVSAY